MTDFLSIRSYWTFSYSVRSERRYLLTPDARSFLEAVQASAGRRVDILPADTPLWRAQNGATTTEVPVDGGDSTVEVDYPFPEERMKPRPGRAAEGRANPKGIPYLYLSSHRDTAAAEVRPWKGGVVSVGRFVATRELRLVNTTLLSRRRLFVGEPKDPDTREEAVWGDIDHAFAEPTTRSDDATEYIPTQVLSELFLEAGYDGVAYRSAYGEGHNVVVFDATHAKLTACFLVHVRDVRFTFELDQEFGYNAR